VVSVLLGAAGAGDAAVFVLLATVPVAAVAGLLSLGDAVDDERSLLSCLPAAASLLLIVAAAATRNPVIALGCPVVLGLGRLRLSALLRPRAVESP
jgi:hypothetical protein